MQQDSKIAFITDKKHASQYEDPKNENGQLMTYLRERGFQPSYQIWDNENIDWTSFDALIIKTTWDYHRRIVEFNAWLNKLEKAGVYVLNSIETIRWNSDKIYLKELEEKGVKTAQTIWLEKGDSFDIDKLFAKLDTEKIIIKPRVSASANHTYALTKEEAIKKKTEIERLLSTENLMAQPFLKEIQTQGEWSLMFFNGVYSHSIMKIPKENDFKVQGGSRKKVEASKEVVETARNIVDNFAKGCLYTRVDGLKIDGKFVLMELELIEPHLFLNESENGFELYHQGLVHFLNSKRN